MSSAEVLSAVTLDTILAVQLTVAWAGEGSPQSPRRLNWWNTDLVDPDGGGNFLERLLPRTHAWASLEAVREAALRIDAAARKTTADPDAMRTIFFLGFELDERVRERLEHHKRSGKKVSEALRLLVDISAPFSADALAKALTKGHEDISSKVVHGGRQLKGAALTQPGLMVQRLAAALVPFAEQYPLPFYRLKS